jgi:alpha-galactosidase
MWDDVLAACPGLFIDNCASGGMRIDLETCARSIPLWRTDATIGPLYEGRFEQAALQNQAMTAGLSRYVPFSTSGQMGATPYLFRSGYNAGISFCEDCRPPEYPRELLRQAIDEAKRLRKYYSGDFYSLTKVTARATDWCVIQLHRTDQQDGMVMAFRRHESPRSSYVCALRGVDANARYELTLASGYVRSAPREVSGDELRRLEAVVDDRPGSLLVEYRKLA